MTSRVPPRATLVVAPMVERVGWGEEWGPAAGLSSSGRGFVDLALGVDWSPLSPRWGIEGLGRIGTRMDLEGGRGWLAAMSPCLWVDPFPSSQLSVLPAMYLGVLRAHLGDKFEQDDGEVWETSQDVWALQWGTSLSGRIGWSFVETGMDWSHVVHAERSMEPNSGDAFNVTESPSRGAKVAMGIRIPIDHLK